MTIDEKWDVIQKHFYAHRFEQKPKDSVIEEIYGHIQKFNQTCARLCEADSTFADKTILSSEKKKIRKQKFMLVKK